MAITELETRKLKIVSVLSMDVTIMDRSPDSHLKKRLNSFIGKTYKVTTSSDNLQKCIIEGEVVCYGDLQHGSLNKAKGGKFDPENLVR